MKNTRYVVWEDWSFPPFSEHWLQFSRAPTVTQMLVCSSKFHVVQSPYAVWEDWPFPPISEHWLYFFHVLVLPRCLYAPEIFMWSCGAAALYMLNGKTSHSLPLFRIGYSFSRASSVTRMLVCFSKCHVVLWCSCLMLYGKTRHFNPVLGGVVDHPWVVLQYLTLEFDGFGPLVQIGWGFLPPPPLSPSTPPHPTPPTYRPLHFLELLIWKPFPQGFL